MSPPLQLSNDGSGCKGFLYALLISVAIAAAIAISVFAIHAISGGVQ